MIGNEAEACAYVKTLCDDCAYAKLERFAELLVDENSRQNLVSRGTLRSIWQRHIADSAQLIEHAGPERLDSPWLDLGTGAGLPGIIVAIIRPALPVKMVESRKRRIEWLQLLASELALPNCEVLGQRLESLAPVEAGVISARAFAPLPKLLDLAARFSNGRTLWLLPKGQSAAQELTELPGKFGKMFHVEQSLTDIKAGIIVGKLKSRQKRRSAGEG